jgi:pyruvate/2-oxoglutarate dehydrogenase complex dihydrolipoamide dehydrogenase (E3) component
MPSVDPEVGGLLGEELGRHGVQVVTDVTVKAIGREHGRLVATGDPDFITAADLVLVVVGVRPDTDLAVAAGVDRRAGDAAGRPAHAHQPAGCAGCR